MTTAYQGNLNVTLLGATVQFTGSSTIAALVNGNWQPASGGATGSAPGDYGGQVSLLFSTGYGAARNLVLDLNSPPLPTTGTNFDSSQLNLSLVTNANPVFDYNSFLGTGSLNLSGTATNSAPGASSVSTNGNVIRLVIQIQSTLTEANDTTLTLTGQIVATNTIGLPPPKIMSFVAANGNLILTATNATVGSKLLGSTNLTTWSPAAATVITNGDSAIFTIPMSQSREFFRVQQ